jgi:transposase
VKRTRELFEHLYGLRVSTGTLNQWIVSTSKRLKNWENETKRSIINAPVAHFDETGVRVAGSVEWIHVASTLTDTLLVPHDKRGSEATDAIGVLPDFRGTAVHDGWMTYFNYENVSHSLCNVHHLRELTLIEELEEEPWATQMKELFKHALHYVHRKQNENKKITVPWIRSIERKYELILKKGYRAYKRHCPKNPLKPRTGIQERRDPGHNLLQRLHYYQKETLAFLSGEIPFSNNQAERDLRMAKVKQKISTSFRSFGGAKGFYRIRSFLSTRLKQGANPFIALSEVAS